MTTTFGTDVAIDGNALGVPEWEPAAAADEDDGMPIPAATFKIRGMDELADTAAQQRNLRHTTTY